MATDSVALCNEALLMLGSKTITALADATDRARLCNQFYNLARQTVLRSHPWNFALKRSRLSTYPAGTLTPGALSGNGVTFTASSSVFIAGDVGSLLVGEASGNTGIARIVGYTSGTVVTADIETAFTSVAAIANRSWRIAPGWQWAYRYSKPSDYLRVWSAEGAGTALRWSWFLRQSMIEGSDPIKIEGQYLLSDYGPTLDILYVADITDTTKWEPLFEQALATFLAHKLAYGITGKEQTSREFFQLYKMHLAEARSIDGQEGTPDSPGPDELIAVRF